MNRLHLYRGFLSISLLLFPVFVFGQSTIYVPGDYASIQGAIDAAESGDTIVVEGSFEPYSENIVLKEGIEIQGSGDVPPTIQGDNYYHTVVMADDCSIRGFTIEGNPTCVYSEGSDVVVEYSKLVGHDLGIQVEAGSIDIIGCEVGGAPPFIAIDCVGASCTIKDCEVQGAYLGIRAEGCHTEISRSAIRGTENGVYVESCSGSLLNCIILDNYLDNVHLRRSDGFIFANNVVYSKGYSLARGVLCFDQAPFIVNNIISDCKFGIMAGPDATPFIMFNDFYRNSGGSYVDFYEDDFSPSPGIGELGVNPYFISATGLDFRLDEASSACIDAGYTSDDYKDTDGSPTDMGAYGGPSAGWVGVSAPPEVKVVANRTVLDVGDEEPFILSISYSNKTGETVEVDSYVAVLADFGLFYLPWLSADPMAQRMFVEPSRVQQTQVIMTIDDMMLIPVGEYTFFAAFAKPGTFDFYSPMSTLEVSRVNRPVAVFTVTPEEARVGETFHFDASDSWDVEDPTFVLKTRWDWNNDGFGADDRDWLFNKEADHSYTTPGTKTIKLEVLDQDGYVGSTTRQVTVTE